VGKIEYIYTLLCYAFNILYTKLGYNIDNKAILQIVVKALNNIVGPNSLILTLLVFRVYLRINSNLLLSLDTTI
ncbi:hypothetical protein P154DRAFT_452617, partial [Amniculicola lignicola CBS 123094]